MMLKKAMIMVYAPGVDVGADREAGRILTGCGCWTAKQQLPGIGLQALQLWQLPAHMSSFGFCDLLARQIAA